MLPGFNHNIRHRSVLFHIQTEDSGIAAPVVVTHLFLGGNIVATRRSSYEKFANTGEVKEIVLAMMKEQHREMMKDLVHDRLRSVSDMLPATEGATVAPAPQPQAPAPPEEPDVPPVGQRPVVPPPEVSPRPYRAKVPETGEPPASVYPPSVGRKVSHPKVDVPTLDTSTAADKTLDELILEFLGSGDPKGR